LFHLFHRVISVANSVETRRLLHGQRLIEPLVVTQDAPSNAREFIGQRRRKLVPVHARGSTGEPSPEAEFVPILGPHQDDIRRLDEERSKIFAASFGAASKDSACAGGVLPRNKPQLGAEVSSAFERFAAADGGDHRCRDQRPDPGDGHEFLAASFHFGRRNQFAGSEDLDAVPQSMALQDIDHEGQRLRSWETHIIHERHWRGAGSAVA
jgi:hypothetical protein